MLNPLIGVDWKSEVARLTSPVDGVGAPVRERLRFVLLVVDVSRVSLSADALDAAEATDAADVARDLVFRSVAVTGG